MIGVRGRPCMRCGGWALRRFKCFRCTRQICIHCRVINMGKFWCSDFAGRTPDDCAEISEARRARALKEIV